MGAETNRDNITVADFFRSVCAELRGPLGSPGEAEAAARIIFEDIAGYDRKYLFMNGDRTITPFMRQRIEAVAGRIAGGCPVQYAVGRASFMGLSFEVSPAVLIPRFETEGLVDLIVDDANGRSDLRVLDIGTGSGCIAIALARALPFARITGMDFSSGALALAKANGKALAPSVRFELQDIFKAVPAPGSYDIIVSNPPYIAESERAAMDVRVADCEPASALFVPDSDPLRFYRAIGRYALTALAPGGRLYFEINSRFPEEMRNLLEDEGYTGIDILRDYRGNYRYARAIRPAR